MFHRIKPGIRRILLVTALAAVTAAGLTAPAHAGDDDAEYIFSPESAALIYAYGGYGYYRWEMMSFSDFSEVFTGTKTSHGLSYDHDATPFQLKRYGLKSNILLFSLGLDVLTDKIEAVRFSEDNSEELQKNQDERARQLQFLSGLRLGNVRFNFNALVREFSSVMTVNGYRELLTNNLLPIWYYPQDGEGVLVKPGETINWYTRYEEYTAKIEVIGRGSTFEFGGKYIRYDAPTEVHISTLTSSSLVAGDVLMFTSNEVYTVFFGFKSLYNIAGDFYLSMYLPVNLAGYYYTDSRYFQIEDKKPFSSNTLSLSTSSTGNFSLQYVRRYIKLEAGVDYSFHSSMLTLNKTKLTNQLVVRDDFDGHEETLNSGTEVDMTFNRMEFFWGYYVQACVYF